MNKYNDKSKGREVFAAQQMLNASHPGPVAAAMLTQEDTASRRMRFTPRRVASKARMNRTGCRPNRN